VTKTIIIGLDGADFRYIDRLIEDNKLPNLRKIISDGFSAEFNSSIVPYTSQAWATILTGRDAGEHGIYDTKIIDEKYNEATSHSKELPVDYFWHYLSEKNVKCLILNVPMTYPVKECKNAAIISGFDAPPAGEKFCYPQDYLQQLKKKGIVYDWQRVQNDLCKIKEVNKRFDEFIRGIWQQYRIINRIAHIEDRQCLFTVFQFTDWINHRTRQSDLIGAIYREMDKVIGELIKSYPDANIFVLSDHGSAPAYYRISINKMLFDSGLLKLKLQTVNHRVIKSGIQSKFHLDGLSSMTGKLYSVLPKRLKMFITKVLVKRFPHLILKCGEINYKKSKAFYKGLGSIYINSKSKFSRGAVDDNEIREIRERIERDLQKINIKEGRPALEYFYPLDVWHFNNSETRFVTPDLIIRAGLPGYYLTGVGFTGKLIEEIKKDIGVHFKTGILLAAGPQIPTVQSRLKASLVDFAPTLFDCIGLPVPNSFVGHSLLRNNSIRSNYQSDNIFKYSKDELCESETEQVEEVLKSLGYL